MVVGSLGGWVVEHEVSKSPGWHRFGNGKVVGSGGESRKKQYHVNSCKVLSFVQ